MSVKTYGEKPVSFQLEEGGEFFGIGSEIVNRIVEIIGKFRETWFDVPLSLNSKVGVLKVFDELCILPLGSGQQVGRSCHLLTFKGKKVLKLMGTIQTVERCPVRPKSQISMFAHRAPRGIFSERERLLQFRDPPQKRDFPPDEPEQLQAELEGGR